MMGTQQRNTPNLFTLMCISALLSLLWTTVSCQCQIVVVVDQSAERDCHEFDLEALHNQTCNDLQDVLLSVAKNITAHPIVDCIVVTVNGGEYRITEFVNISQNVVLRGTHNATVMFDFSSADYDPKQNFEPYYVFSFTNANSVQITGIHFYSHPSSPGIVRFENITTLEVENCSFRYFIQGAVDVYNCHNILFSSCIFEHNGPVPTLKQGQFRGHSGGLSVGFHNNTVMLVPLARITGCVFRNNTSDPPTKLQQTTTQLFQNFIFIGRGGGCAMVINALFAANVTIEKCLFEENLAQAFGSALYLQTNAYSNHTIILNNTNFTRNTAPGTAGAIEIGFLPRSLLRLPVAPGPNDINSVLVYNSQFIENTAVFGGSVYFFTADPPDENGRLHGFAHFENCTFRNNSAEEFGAAIAVVYIFHFGSPTESIIPVEIESCNFINNDGGGGGTVSTTFMPLSFKGSNRFEENRGRALVILATRVDVHGEISFVSNDGSVRDSGALYATSLGQLQLFQGASISFENNTGNLGAAVVVDNPLITSTYSQLIFNPLCLLRYQDPTLAPDEWPKVSLSFSGNKAVVASAVYMNFINTCSWVQFGYPWFNVSRTFGWSFTNYTTDNQNTAHNSSDRRWYVQTPTKNITATNTQGPAYPGEVFPIGLSAFDELGRPTAAVVRLSDETGGADYIIGPTVITLNQLNQSTVNISFFETASGTAQQSESIAVESLLGVIQVTQRFNVSSTKCPSGYVPSTMPLEAGLYSTCTCNFNDTNIVDCRGRNIYLMEGLWGTESHTTDSLTTYPCPLGYCHCSPLETGSVPSCNPVFNSSDPNRQCTCNREGFLCGSCKNGRGVSALLNRCVNCHNASGLLIAGLVIADVLVFIVLLLATEPFPSWLYPCVFYLQILPILTEHFPLTFEKIHPYVLYASSASSFYFVYDFCLNSDLSALVSYFIRFIPFLLAVVLYASVLIVRRQFKLQKWHPWYGFWWIFLLLYTHTVHASMSLLNCPILPSADGSEASRWFINGDVKCFTGGHIPLGLLAIFVLACCVGVIPLGVVYSKGWLQRPVWLRRSVVVTQEGFKEKQQLWAAVELSRRLLLVLFILAFPGNEYPATIVLSVIIAVFGFVQPYNSMIGNILETAFAVDIMVLLLLRNTEQINDELQVLQLRQQSSSECEDPVEGITNMTTLLLPFYYIPLAVTLTAVLVWSGMAVWRYGVKGLWERLIRKGDRSVLNPNSDNQRSLPTMSQVTVSELVDVLAEDEEEFKGPLEDTGEYRCGYHLLNDDGTTLLTAEAL